MHAHISDIYHMVSYAIYCLPVSVYRLPFDTVRRVLNFAPALLCALFTKSSNTNSDNEKYDNKKNELHRLSHYGVMSRIFGKFPLRRKKFAYIYIHTHTHVMNFIFKKRNTTTSKSDQE